MQSQRVPFNAVTAAEKNKDNVKKQSAIAYSPITVSPEVLSRINPFFALKPCQTWLTRDKVKRKLAAATTKSCHSISQAGNPFF